MDNIRLPRNIPLFPLPGVLLEPGTTTTFAVRVDISPAAPQVFLELIVEPAAADATRQLGPLSELQTLQGFEFIFDGVARSQLNDLGTVHTP